jgi:hypothetical protein
MSPTSKNKLVFLEDIIDPDLVHPVTLGSSADLIPADPGKLFPGA